MAEKKKKNKKKVAIIAAAVAAAVAVAGVASYFAFFKDDGKNPDSESENAQEEIEGDLPSSNDDVISSSDGETKYGDAEVYTNKNGNRAAKTESGVEVEFTEENITKLFEEYEKEKGSGSEREKEILDQIQLILEATQKSQ